MMHQTKIIRVVVIGFYKKMNNDQGNIFILTSVSPVYQKDIERHHFPTLPLFGLTTIDRNGHISFPLLGSAGAATHRKSDGYTVEAAGFYQDTFSLSHVAPVGIYIVFTVFRRFIIIIIENKAE